MDIRVVSAFIKQLEKAEFSRDTIVLNKQRTVSGTEINAYVDIIDPKTKYVLYRFDCTKPTAPFTPQSTPIKATDNPPAIHDDTKPDDADEPEQGAKTLGSRLARWLKSIMSPGRAKPGAEEGRRKRKSYRLPIFTLVVKSEPDAKSVGGYRFLLIPKASRRKKGSPPASDDKPATPSSVANEKSSLLQITDLVPAYVLQNDRQSLDMIDKEDEKDSKLNLFNAICYSGALLTLALAVLNFLTILKLNDMQYAMLAAVVVLLIMPQTKKLKMLGVEYERYEPEDKRNAQSGSESGGSGSAATDGQGGRKPETKTVDAHPAPIRKAEADQHSPA